MLLLKQFCRACCQDPWFCALHTDKHLWQLAGLQLRVLQLGVRLLVTMSAPLLQRPSGLYRTATDHAAAAHDMAAKRATIASADLQLGNQRLRRGQLGLQCAPLHPHGLRLGLPHVGCCSCRASCTLEEVYLGHAAATR